MSSNLPVHVEKSTALPDEPLHVVGFSVGNEEFCVDILKVQEIIRMVPITVMPNAPDFVEGVIDLRGRVIPIIDFRKRFHLYGETGTDEEKRIIVAVYRDVVMGMIVDRVSQVMKLAPDQISPAPAVVKGVETDYIIGVARVGEKLVVVLDLEELFAEYEMDATGA